MPSALKEKLVFGKDNFLIETYKEENQSVWTWLNDFLVERCRRDSSCEEPLDYYCEILGNVKSSTLEDFFENSPFRNKYRRTISSKTCGRSNCEHGDAHTLIKCVKSSS